MLVYELALSRALSKLVVLVILAIATALLPAAAVGQASAASAPPGGASDPGGNNGTVKIVEDGDFDSIPNNDPHVGCTFSLEWYGFDKGADIISTVTFEMQAPTASVGLTVDGPPTVFVGGDPASGAGTPTGLDGRQAYTLSFDGPPHPIQGYHLKLTIETPGSQGSDKKYKVFWVEGCDPVQPPTPGLSLEKSVTDSHDPGSDGQLGETLTYAFSVTNTGNVPLTNVTISDAKLGMSNVACVANLAVGETKPCTTTKSYVVTAADIASGSVHNTATGSAKPPTGPPVSDDDDATIPTPSAPAIVLEKSVTDSPDPDSIGSLGETLTYTFKVTNTGNVPLTNVKIDDAKLGLSNVACVSTLAVGATATCPTVAYTVTAGDVADGKVYNEATAKGKTPSGGEVTDKDDAKIATKKNTPDAPGISLEKSVADVDADGVGSLGEVLTYTFTVTNTGNVVLAPVTISDTKLAMTNVPCVASLAVGATAVCPTKIYPVSSADIGAGSIHNIAIATGTPPSGPGVTDDDDVTIQTPAKPRIHLEKSVADGFDADTIAGPGEVLTYTFVVTNTGNVPLTNVVIDDVKLGMSNVACVASLPVGASATCPTKSYTTTSGDVAAGSIHNTASATGTPPSGPSVTDDDDATICTAAAMPYIFLDKQVLDSSDTDSVGSLGEVLTYTFQVTNTGNVDLTDVTIGDPMFGLSNAPCVGFLAVGATTSCPLLPAQSHTVTQADVDHGSVDNTATTSGTPPTGPKVTDDDTANMPVTGGDPGDVDLVVDKSSNVSIAGPGDEVTYTINVRNQGDGDAHGVVVTDTLPQGTTYVSSSAPCTYASGTVSCNIGTIVAGDDQTVTITVKVNAIASGGGNTSHQHQLDYTKVESHISSFSGVTTSTTQCPSGYVATDGSVRLDHVDQGTGGFEDVDVLTSAVTSDGKGWTGAIRNNTTGQVQAKVEVVCASERTVSGEDHSNPLVITGPSASTQTFGPGRRVVDLTCAAGSYPIQPSYVLTAGTAVVGTRGAGPAWQFIVDVDTSATGTFSIHCLSSAVGAASGHSHDLVFTELSDTVTVPAGQTVEKRLTCPDGYKGIVAWADIDPGLVSLGNDPQPITRVFKFHNPTGGPLSARFGLLCVSIRTNGADNPGSSQITNTASAATSSRDANTGNNSDSATVTVNPTGVTVTPRATVGSNAGKTTVRLDLATGSRRSVTLRLLAAGRVAGLRSGAVLARGRATLEAGSESVRLVARGAAAKALRSGKIGKATLVIVSKGQREVMVIKLR
ncbi:hypothetical protein NPS01_34210 [Nocardioides psychrotolerans]|uniref:Conserved repeat domain-containing protein n=1 Tax=Nocardioides psychrotolerans TaxID=1005945 RepID=A0A1I3CF21_9ACTN|nr:DUF11 domain-containing protein [Nocardioides psychrotolerans]GEP39758.1 hypothetical protein NPS01_34210 [Nocardioides psychrotolerans]SFH72936.1 conserved repeat domain-containing protein [Nocardioides psychrotolerans]